MAGTFFYSAITATFVQQRKAGKLSKNAFTSPTQKGVKLLRFKLRGIITRSIAWWSVISVKLLDFCHCLYYTNIQEPDCRLHEILCVVHNLTRMLGRKIIAISPRDREISARRVCRALCSDGLTQYRFSYLFKAIRHEQVCEQIVAAAFVPPRWKAFWEASQTFWRNHS